MKLTDSRQLLQLNSRNEFQSSGLLEDFSLAGVPDECVRAEW